MEAYVTSTPTAAIFQAVSHTVPRPQTLNPRISGRALVVSRPLTLPPQPNRIILTHPTLPDLQAYGGTAQQGHGARVLYQSFTGETT